MFAPGCAVPPGADPRCERVSMRPCRKRWERVAVHTSLSTAVHQAAPAASHLVKVAPWGAVACTLNIFRRKLLRNQSQPCLHASRREECVGVRGQTQAPRAPVRRTFDVCPRTGNWRHGYMGPRRSRGLESVCGARLPGKRCARKRRYLRDRSDPQPPQPCSQCTWNRAKVLEQHTLSLQLAPRHTRSRRRARTAAALPES